MNTLEELPNNPFLPGHPVSPDRFIGREDDIKKIIRYLPRVISHGLPEHFFITGKRGMGKTSFINYAARIADDRYNMLPIYINNEGTNTIDELISKLLEKLFRELHNSSKNQEFINAFFNRFELVNVGGFGFKFKDQPNIVEDVKDNFIEFLTELSNNLEDNDGVFIIIDDINGLSQTPEFANWYKALFETLEFYQEYVPIVFSLVTYPAKFDQLCEQNPSFSRMFNLIEIDTLNTAEVEEFFIKTFSDSNIEFEDKNCLKDMVYYSGGMPLVMQQIGDAIFWNLEDNCINEEIAYEGIKNAAYELRNKPLKSTLNKIKNPHYNNILLKLGENEKLNFKKADLNSLLNDNEKMVIDEFIEKMLNLNIFEVVDEEYEEYEFANKAYYVYFLICSTFNTLFS